MTSDEFRLRRPLLLTATRYCAKCKQHVRAIRQPAGTVAYPILAVVLCGGLTAFILPLLLQDVYRCRVCGRKTGNAMDRVMFVVLCVLMVVLAVVVSVPFIHMAAR